VLTGLSVAQHHQRNKHEHSQCAESHQPEPPEALKTRVRFGSSDNSTIIYNFHFDSDSPSYVFSNRGQQESDHGDKVHIYENNFCRVVKIRKRYLPFQSLFPSPSDTTKDVMLVWTVNPVSAQKIMMTDPGQIFLKILPISTMLGIFASMSL
jgi:hypothetical protein